MTLSFAVPWILAGLVLLPLLWLMLRVTPPPARRQSFPPLRLLLGLQPTEATAARTPPWLLWLRIAVAALAIIGLAGPLLGTATPPGKAGTSGPLLLVLDTGWDAAADWEARRDAALAVLDTAAKAGRPVRVLTTAPRADGEPLAVSPLGPAEAARASVAALAPEPWPDDLAAAAKAVHRLTADAQAGDVVWLTAYLDRPDADALTAALRVIGPLTLLTPPAGHEALVISGVTGQAVTLTRTLGGALPARSIDLRAVDTEGHGVATVAASFAAGSATATATIPLPNDLARRMARVEAADPGLGRPADAAAVRLLDDPWSHRSVGIAASDDRGSGLPLLSDVWYAERALQSLADVKTGPVPELLAAKPSLMILTDGRLPAADRASVVEWVKSGGTLVRFAGPDLAGHPIHTGDDPLLPVGIRAGGRSFGGSLSWDKPATLAPFTADSPFAGLAVPSDVSIRTQVLAEPSPDLDRRTWARLEDGTPLVTGARLGDGWVVLIHTSANADWTDLPLSGLFPAMLDRLLHLSHGSSQSPQDAAVHALPPLQSLDGFGRLGEPSPLALPLPPTGATPGPTHPPGWYGTASDRRAANLAGPDMHPRTLTPPAGVTVQVYGGSPAASGIDLSADVLLAALALFLIDLIASFSLRGLIRATAGLILAVGFVTGHAPSGRAADLPPVMPEAAQQTRLAYVTTGLGDVDAVSASGLETLTRVVSSRSSAELADPVALDLANPPAGPDPLVFFPLIYWPAANGQHLPDAAARSRIAAYMAHGGVVVIDGRGPENAEALRTLLATLDVPALSQMPDSHVLTRSFYLTHGLPGRVEGGPVWLTAATPDEDGVSPLIIGAADWAGAWAADDSGRPSLPMETGGERGRELALRAGVNMVMYALTGTYKADQVHLQAILERLSQ